MSSSTAVFVCVLGMEDRSFAEDSVLVRFRGLESCSTCTHFRFAVLGQCQVLGSCHLRQRLLVPGAHTLKRCEQWIDCSPVNP